MQKAAVIAWLQSATKYSRIIVACMVSIDRMVTLLSATAAAGSPVLPLTERLFIAITGGQSVGAYIRQINPTY